MLPCWFIGGWLRTKWEVGILRIACRQLLALAFLLQTSVFSDQKEPQALYDLNRTRKEANCGCNCGLNTLPRHKASDRVLIVEAESLIEVRIAK
jgi:hypothetical protein